LTPPRRRPTLAAAMAAQTSTSSNDPVKQFSAFVENRVGRLHDLTGLLKANNVHIIAITVLDSTDSPTGPAN
jgi:hypothetical protein